MPMYDYRCPDCTTHRVIFKKLEQFENREFCHKCNAQMERMISAPMVIGDYQAYNCPITGALIDGKRQHRENLKRHGCRVLEEGESAMVRKSAARADAQLDKEIDETVEEFVETLPTAKREQLVAEVQNGLDVQLTRN